MGRTRKKIIENDFIDEEMEKNFESKLESPKDKKIEEKVVIPKIKIEEEKEHSFFVSDERFSTTWEQPNNECNRAKLYQTLEIKTENCNDKDYFVLQSERWCFSDVDDLIYILLDFKKRYEKMKTP
jgi:hypothetical protein